MRVLMLSQFFAPVIGGEEAMVEAMSVELARRGHDVAVATLRTGDLPAHETRNGVRVHRVGGAVQRLPGLYSDPERPHVPPVPDPLLMRNLAAVVRREHPDVIHGHDWLANSMTALKPALRRPLVLSLHDHSLVCATRRLVREDKPCSGPAAMKCLACASHHYGTAKGAAVAMGTRVMRPVMLSTVDMFLPVSRAVARRALLPELDVTWEVLPNFISEDALLGDVNRPPEGLPDDGFILFVGDVSSDKGADVLLEAYAQLSDPSPLVLIGRPLSDRLSPPPPNVVVLGRRPHSEVLAAWRRSGLGVVPSITEETFGLVALEAMAAGRALVASDHGGLPEVIDAGETGLLVPPNDVAALREALGRLQADEQLRRRMGHAGRRRAHRFTATVVVPRLEAIYRKVVGPR